MKVYADRHGQKQLVGRSDVPEDVGPVFRVALFGAASTITENFMIGTVTHLPATDGAPVVERAVLLAAGQYPDILPGWQPLAS